MCGVIKIAYLCHCEHNAYHLCGLTADWYHSCAASVHRPGGDRALQASRVLGGAGWTEPHREA